MAHRDEAVAGVRAAVAVRPALAGGPGRDLVVAAEVADVATTIRGLAEVGELFYVAVIGTQLTLVLLAAPAATAGAICLDRARGTLTHLLVTDLSDSEIVLGKLAARLVPVLGLVVCRCRSWRC